MGTLPAKPPLKGEVPAKRAEGFVPKRRKVAAALSAAVTTTMSIGDTPTLQAEPSQKKRPNSNASRSSGERGLGGEALLSEKRPLPPEASAFPETSLRKGVRGRTLLYREAFSPAPPFEEMFLGKPKLLGGEAASLREAPLPPDPSLPKSGWRLSWDVSSDLVPPEGWACLR